MSLEFEIGDSAKPRGHALVVFGKGGAVAVSYVIAMPFKMDIKRYLPPFLTAQLGDSRDGGDMPFIVFPPAPEEVPDGLEFVLKLARKRGDDVIDGGTLGGGDPTGAMSKLMDIAKEYTDLCESSGVRHAGESTASDIVQLPANEYADLSVEERLNTATQLAGDLFYAVSGGDKNAAQATASRIRVLAKTFPGNIMLEKVAEYGISSAENSRLLAELYLERAYKFHAEEYLRVKEIEDKINSLRD